MNYDQFELLSNSSLVNHEEQISQHYTNTKEPLPKDPVKKEQIIKVKPEETIEKIENASQIDFIRQEVYSSVHQHLSVLCCHKSVVIAKSSLV